MMKKILLGMAVVVVALAGTGVILYAWNSAPALPPISAADASAGKPYVVKLHARWCPVCLVTKDVWSEIESAYAGRANLLVLDITNDRNAEASRAEARRLGLEAFFDESYGATGVIAVLDGRTRELTAWLDGNRDAAEYRAAIDAALTRSSR
jgi:hypothetical protein